MAVLCCIASHYMLNLCDYMHGRNVCYLISFCYTYIFKEFICRWKHIRKKIKPVGEVIFGAHPVLNALTASYRSYFYRMYVDSRQQRSPSLSLIDILNTADGKKVPIEFVSKVHLDCLSALRPHQVIAIADLVFVAWCCAQKIVWHYKAINTTCLCYVIIFVFYFEKIAVFF